MKSIADLTLEDLTSIPIWRYLGCIDADAQIEPTDKRSLGESERETFIAASDFTLSDGTIFGGYSSPSDPSGIDYVQPVILTKKGQVRFWFDHPVSAATLQEQWRSLEKTEDQIFPVRWRSRVPVDKQIVEGLVKRVEFGSANQAL